MSLMTTLMLSCRKAMLLMEQRTVAPLSAMDQMQLWMHLRVCDGCRAFEKQNATIERLMEKRDEKPAPVDATALEQRILSAARSLEP